MLKRDKWQRIRWPGNFTCKVAQSLSAMVVATKLANFVEDPDRFDLIRHRFVRINSNTLVVRWFSRDPRSCLSLAPPPLRYPFATPLPLRYERKPEFRSRRQGHAPWLSSSLHITSSSDGMTGIRANWSCSRYTHPCLIESVESRDRNVGKMFKLRGVQLSACLLWRLVIEIKFVRFVLGPLGSFWNDQMGSDTKILPFLW